MQHLLYFFPLPQGHGSLRPAFSCLFFTDVYSHSQSISVNLNQENQNLQGIILKLLFKSRSLFMAIDCC